MACLKAALDSRQNAQKGQSCKGPEAGTGSAVSNMRCGVQLGSSSGHALKNFSSFLPDVLNLDMMKPRRIIKKTKLG